MKKVLVFLVSLYVCAPVCVFLFPWILGFAVFGHWNAAPFFVDLTRPELLLNHTVNFYLNPEPQVSVGVWHSLPSSLWAAAQGRSSLWYEAALGDGRPVVIFLHGNGGTRAAEHRVGLVKKLTAAGFHVFSLDYRGFGDSSGDPTEAGVTKDALYLYHWVKRRSRGNLICLWGQSLGTGVATNAAVRLQNQGSGVDVVVLQAAYTSVRELVALDALAQPYIFLPGFKSLIWTLLEKIEIEFANDKNLQTLTSPVLLLHAKDDTTVPFSMAQEEFLPEGETSVCCKVHVTRVDTNTVVLLIFTNCILHSLFFMMKCEVFT
ncbi:lysophosphatidylserine lipase ABHD12 isoform X2 [Boleophthalmus pectinirostris]|uniref:lysophosphatidylserine lipase ABHD12 isoform X2 n=1 Tax=Boleophthalmus pectinirostris TaxID=150288 RepID=UPI00242A566A|nr:lysophosphatidylserine lipase ABHD12 isoform X2 [Boleophthalmus pectinirostris]